MSPVEFSVIAFVIAVAAGLFGSLVGLGGGIIVVPGLTMLLHVDIRYAIGASIVSVIATSSGAGAAYVREHLANMRLAMFLELATTIGALCGGYLAGVIPGRWLYAIFGLVMAYAAMAMWRRGRSEGAVVRVDKLSARLALGGGYYDPALSQRVDYRVGRSRSGFAISYFAGVVSGLLGVGGGIIKVPTMNLIMGVPLKAATATSNFMIGVTAAASAGVYFARGDIDPLVAAPVAAGVLIGATTGSRLLGRLHHSLLRLAFTAVLVFMAIQMLLRGLR